MIPLFGIFGEMASIAAQALVDEDGKLNARIKELEGDLSIANLQVEAGRQLVAHYRERNEELEKELAFTEAKVSGRDRVISHYKNKLEEQQDRIFDLEIQVAKLSTPLWFKIVAWFAR